MKRTSRALARCSRLPATAARSGILVATVASVALALAPLGLTPVTALATTSPTPTASAAASPATAPVGHLVLARIEGTPLLASYLPVDAPLLDASPPQTLRVRFQLDNTATDAITVNAQLEYRADGGDAYTAVPEEPQTGKAFNVARETVSSPGGGSEPSALGQDIAVSDLRLGDGGGQAATGHHSMGLNPDVPITLPANSYTEEEFTVRLTSDVGYLSGYELRITDAGAPLPGTAAATVRVGTPLPTPGSTDAGQSPPAASPSASANADPSSGASPRASSSAAASPSASAKAGASAASSAAASPNVSASATSAAATSSPEASAGTAASAAGDPAAGANAASPTDAAPEAGASAVSAAPASMVRYALVSGPTTPAGESSGIHGPYSMTTDQCAMCHRGHTAKAPNLLTDAGSQSNLCFTCHGGLGATLDVQSQYTGTSANSTTSTTREIYSHDVTAPSTHTGSDLAELKGVSNRHSECADCHNPHDASATTISAPTPTGWSASTRVAGATGVSVVNGAAGSQPTYALAGGKTNPLTREYQLCFKCHSSFTVLPDNAGFAPSSALLDKAVEFNPNNASFHPIEAPGTNKTAAMQASLAESPFTTDSTIRCSNCHAGSGAVDPATPLAASDDLAPHASKFQGILLQNYRSRALKSSTEGYDENDFALCFMCHSQSPFTDQGSSNGATNFSLHGKHVADLRGKGAGSAGTNIDTAGAGQGNAICSECHFRLHSTTFKFGQQEIDGSRLVNFAPNVVPNIEPVSPDPGVPISWTPAGAPGGGSCTLTCHGVKHDGKPY